MSSGRPHGMRREQSRPAAGWSGRARAERLWQESVAQPRPPADNDGGSDGPLLTPALSSSRGGEGEKAVTTQVPSPPLGAERDRVRWGRVASRDSFQPRDKASKPSCLPNGPATRKLRALWHSAYHLGLIHDRSDDALGAWLHRLARLDGDAAVAPAGLDRPIQALKAWLARSAGVDWRPHLSLGRDGRVWERRRPRARVLEAQWRLLHRRGGVRIGSEAALGAYAARHAGLGRAESHLALDDAQADALIRHFGRRIRAASERHDWLRASPRCAG